MLKVLILGATGRIGPGFIEEYIGKYKDKYNLIIGIHNKKVEYDIEQRKVELNDIESLKDSFRDVDVVINLAANADQKSEFMDLVHPNIIGAYNVFEAAKLAGCKRVIFASSVHAIKGYPLRYPVKSHETPKPINFYGATKAFGEALCNVYSSNFGMSCLAIRVGAYVSNDHLKKVCFERDTYDYIITQRDFAQLIYRCIVASFDIKYGVLSGISDNKHKSMDIDFTRELVGYEPMDDAFSICEEIKSLDITQL
jgi:nucleoside-diphosphate-sugar epimerase